MWSMMDWILGKLNLSDVENDVDMNDASEDIILWLEKVGKGKVGSRILNQHIFCKKVKSYDDSREVLHEYKSGAECVISFYPSEDSDAQGMMNYICGGVFALGGEIKPITENIFMILHSGNCFCKI